MSFTSDFAAGATVAGDDWVVAIVGSRILVRRTDQSVLLVYHQLRAYRLEPLETLYLGRWHEKPCFAFIFSPDLALPDDFPFATASLRGFLGIISDDLFWLVGRAQQLAHWAEFHRFCGRCGRGTEFQLHERVLACVHCGALFYPRIAPCVIGVVTRDDRCLLAHNANFTEGLYSAIAGFIEPGETAEQALLREIKEETGIEAEQLEYVCSQPWPFPSQLMLGFIARYKSGDIVVDGAEITDAAWFKADELPRIPPPHTISGKLIDIFIRRTRTQG